MSSVKRENLVCWQSVNLKTDKDPLTEESDSIITERADRWRWRISAGSPHSSGSVNGAT